MLRLFACLPTPSITQRQSEIATLSINPYNVNNTGLLERHIRTLQLILSGANDMLGLGFPRSRSGWLTIHAELPRQCRVTKSRGAARAATNDQRWRELPARDVTPTFL